MLKNLAIGKAGELRVASELLIRGQEVYLNLVDSGSDLTLGNGKRIQVKSAQRTLRKEGYSQYAFSFKSWRKREKEYIPHNLEGIDFVILWAINDDEFFIIPSSEIRGKYSVKLSLGKREWTRYGAYKDKWESLN